MNPDNVSRHPPPPPSVTRQPHGAGPSLPHPLAPPVGPPPPWAPFTVASAAAAFGALAAALGPVLRCIVPSVGATAPASISLAGNHGIKRPNPMRDTKVLFNLSGNALGKVGGSGMPKLCRAIQRNLPEGTALSILSLPEEGARPLSEALRENETITTLDLSGNALGMGDRGCVLFWDCLVVNKTLRILILINNAIGGQGAEFLAEGLRQNAAVHSVFLYRNAIGDRGAVALAEALKVNTAITNLYLQWNGITDAGAAVLAAAMKVNATVQVLDLSNNDVANVRILQSIKESCQRNREGRPLPELPPDRYPRRAVPTALAQADPRAPLAPALGGYGYPAAAAGPPPPPAVVYEDEEAPTGPVVQARIESFQRFRSDDDESETHEEERLSPPTTAQSLQDNGADRRPPTPPRPRRALREADDAVPLSGV